MRFGQCAAPKGPTQPGARDAPCRVATPAFHQLIPLFILALFLSAGSTALAQKGAQLTAPKAAPKAVIIKPGVPAAAQPTATEVPKVVPKVAPGVTPVFPTATPAATPDATIVEPLTPTPGANAISTTTSNVTIVGPASAKNAKKVSGASERYKQVDYWDEVHRREREKRLRELRETEQKRAAVQKAAPGIIKDGESLRPILPVEDFVSTPPPPSILEDHRDYFLLGLTGILMISLTAYTLFRHRREREIRILTGKYLSDGTEAAWIQMPHLFAGAPASSPHVGLDLSEKSGEKDDAPADVPTADTPLTKFFKDAPNDLAEIRKLLPELSKTDEAERKKAFFALYALIDNLRTKAIGWDLRPVWQLSSALTMLVKRLAEKSKEATPTTIRTVATAIDLLSDLCVPGVRPDLIISPPIAVLAVDDDPLCLRAVMFALQKAEMTPETAETGEKAIELATEKSYDVIFMDIKMPGIDGLRACEKIHELKKNENTPVVFVTALSDFRTRAESTLVGGSDLLIKPFLMFEITVKVLIFTMRKRLGLAASLKREVASLTGASQIEGKAVAVLPAPHPAIPDELDEVEAPATRNVPVQSGIPDASQPDKAIAALPALHPAIPVEFDKVEAARKKEDAVLPEVTASVEVPVNGANGSHHSTAAEELSEPKKGYEGADLPTLRMAPAASLVQETRAVQTIPDANNGDRKTKKWLKRQKELASLGKFE